MNLIKKLGADFFREKFNKGIFRIEDKLFLVLDVISKPKDTSKEAQLKAKMLKETAYNAESALDEHREKRPDKYGDAVYDEAAELYDEDEYESIEDYINDHMPDSPTTEEYTTWRSEEDRLRDVWATHRAEWSKFAQEQQATAGTAVTAIDFEKKAVVQIDEDEFKSIRMFWDFEEGYRVLKTEGNRGFPMWVGPSLTGARCIKLPQREARVRDTTKELNTNDEINLYRYSFYTENDRWKDIITPEGLSFEEALQEIVSSPNSRSGEEGAILLKGGKAYLQRERGSEPAITTLYYQEMPIAQLNKEGTPIKVRKGMLMIAEEEGSVPCLIKK